MFFLYCNHFLLCFKNKTGTKPKLSHNKVE